jgi:hypothetical protein
MKKDSHLF